MRILILLFGIIFPVAVFCQEVSMDQLEERDNHTFYLISSGEQYTGPVIGKYANGQKKYEGTFKKGLHDKKWIEYDEDGMKIFVDWYKKNKHLYE